MTKSDLVKMISEKTTSLSFGELNDLVNFIFDKMVEALAQSRRIEIRGFGTFEIRLRNSRSARNPKTGDSVFVSTRRVPFFKVGKELKDRVNR